MLKLFPPTQTAHDVLGFVFTNDIVHCGASFLELKSALKTCAKPSFCAC